MDIQSLQTDMWQCYTCGYAVLSTMKKGKIKSEHVNCKILKYVQKMYQYLGAFAGLSTNRERSNKKVEQLHLK